MNNQKGSATVILLVVLVVILAAVFVYFVFLKKPGEVAISPTPTLNPTADWKTYSSKYGYSIKYPAQWSIDINRSDEYTIIFNPGNNNPGSRESIEAIPFHGTLQEYIRGLDASVILKQTDMTIAGRQAVKIDTSEFAASIVVVAYNNYVYRFDTQGLMLTNGMLDTFKFTK